MDETPRRIRSYVIRAARMSDAQKAAYDRLYPRWGLGPDAKVKWENLFPEPGKRVVEIGFGMGDATRVVAEQHPEWNILAIEVHRPGIGKLLWWMEQEGLGNIRIIEGDAVEIFAERIPSCSVDSVHIWFPDPWPKKRHHKRRLLKTDFVDIIVSSLRPGGRIHAATDWEPYAGEILDTFENTRGLKNCYPEWAPGPGYRPETKFEKKGRNEHRIIRDIIFEKEHR